ncbi:nuclear mRNA export, poly(A)+RNA binding protein [Serendipita sp. 398]|nr:nuclear mRNA export, poly(A)+RNA binding protein [Serendipita sp. 398]
MSTSLPVTPQRPRATPMVSAPRRNAAGQLLKKTGLLRGAGEDISMHDSTASKPQHRSMRSRLTAQSKALEAVKNKAASAAPQKATTIKGRSGTPPDARGPIRSRLPKRTQNADVSVIQTWKTVIQSRYNAQARFLNLDNLSTDPELLSRGIPFNKIRESRELQVIMKVASQLEPVPITISLAHNGLDGSHIFSSLHRYIPNVVNLSLTGNKVRSSKDMEIFAGPKWVLTKLRELILLDNPIYEMALAQGKIEEYRKEITRKFPSLEILDNVPVPHISAGSRNLMKTHGSLQDARDRLFTGADDILVGLGLLPTTKHIVAEGEKFVVDTVQMDLGAGPQLFITIHGEFVEAPGVIDGIRSFDRSLILSPAPDGSYAKQNGWDAMIISDQLNIRSYSSHESWAVGPMSTQAQEIAAVIASGSVHSSHPTRVTGDTSHMVSSASASTSGSTIPANSQSTEQLHPLLADLGDSQRASMVQLQAITGLNFQYTMMCLEANGWDFAQAKVNYDELVNSNPPMIPPEAYIQV